MADVPEVPEIHPLLPVSSRSGGGAYRQRAQRDAGQRKRTPEQIRDTANVLGIPQAELTPKVLEALALLIDELDALHGEIEVSHHHEQRLVEEADRHPLFPVLGARAFGHALARAANHVARTETPSCLLLMDIPQASRARRELGLAAGNAVMVHAAEVLKVDLRAIDAIGGVGGDGLAILLNLADKKAAEEKGQRLAGLLAAAPARWEDRQVEIAPRWGLAAVGAGAEPGNVLEAADRDLRRRQGGG